MSETKSIAIPVEISEQLRDISRHFKRLNTGSTSDEFWIGSGITNDYSWTQIDLGVDRNNHLIYSQQSGCSCYGPEQPSVDQKHELSAVVVITYDEWVYQELKDAVDELVKQTPVIHAALTGASVSAEAILALPNAEIRRAVVELVGYDKIVDRAEVLDESDTDGRLLKIKQDSDEDIVLVHVKDPSTDREYFLRVPPTIKTARQARAWTFGFDGADFKPVVEQ